VEFVRFYVGKFSVETRLVQSLGLVVKLALDLVFKNLVHNEGKNSRFANSVKESSNDTVLLRINISRKNAWVTSPFERHSKEIICSSLIHYFN